MKQELEGLLARISAATPLSRTARDAAEAPASGVDKAALAAELRLLAAQLREDDAGAGRTAPGIARQIELLGHSALAGELQKRIARYAFEEALETVEEIALIPGLAADP